MKHIRALIVEDEPLARAALLRLVEGEKDIALVGECADGLAALKAIRRHRPQLIFLDVRLPGLNGIELLKALDGDLPPVVIFVTAHNGYAVPAFDAAAVDFLLKPFTRERFCESLERARQRLRKKPSLESDIAALAQIVERRQRTASVLSLKVGERKARQRFALIRADEIAAVVADGNYSVVHTNATSHRTRRSLDVLEKKLPPGKFVRINRSTIVNAQQIKEILPKAHGDSLVRLSNGCEFPLARRYRTNWSTLCATNNFS